MDRIGAVDVVLTTFVAGAIAWAVHATLVRVHWARFWPFVGSTALAISISGPGRYADGEAAVALIVMHFIVAVILITGFSMMAPLVDVLNDGQERRFFRLPGMPRREAY